MNKLKILLAITMNPKRIVLFRIWMIKNINGILITFLFTLKDGTISYLTYELVNRNENKIQELETIIKLKEKCTE